MKSYICFLILFMGLFLPGVSAWAQSTCPEDFSQISPSCIQASSQVKFVAKNIRLNNELKDDIFFYKTANGALGKLKVISTVVTPTECTFYMDAVTYGGADERVFIPNSSLSIGVGKNNWLKETAYLDKEGASALELVRTQSMCVLVLTKDVEFGKYFDQKSEDVELWKESNELLKWTPAVLIFIAIFLIVRVFMEEQDKFKTQEALEEAENTSKVKNQPMFLKVTRPFYKRYFLPLTQGKNKAVYRTRYRQKLANAGLAKEMAPEEFMALKLFMIIGGPAAFLVIRWFLEETWPLSLTPIMGIAGYIYPNIWLSGLISKRGDEILRAMPFITDMLALSVEAGLDFMAAIQRVIEKAPPSPLVDEFETLIKETKIGSSRAEGLRQLSWRVNIIEVNSFCATLVAADSVGASVGPILKQLSTELRVKRTARAEQAGAKAATKILIPMIFFILPAVLVAMFAPMALKMLTTGGF